MMKAAAIAAQAAEPRPMVPFLKTGTPADDAWATLAHEMYRRTATMAADLARKANKIEALILDGTAQESKKRADAHPNNLGYRCCDAGVFAELEFESIPQVAAALAVSGVLSGGGDALVGGVASAGLGAVPAPSLCAVDAALVVAIQ